MAFLLSLSPFLYMYRFPFIKANVAFYTYLLLFVITMVKRKGKIKSNDTNVLVLPLAVIMFFYCIFSFLLVDKSTIYNSGGSNLTSICSTFVFIFLAVITFDNEKLRDCYRKNIEYIAMFMSIVVIAQYIFYYFFHTTITVDRSFLLPLKSLFTDGVISYISVSDMMSNGMFRPSAFFLEPAHFSQFCSIGLASLLIREENIINKKTMLVTFGIILTTSGIGILTVLMLWGYVLVMNNETLSAKVLTRIIIGFVVLLLILVVFFLVSSAFRMAILRITTEYDGHASAIEGRLWSRSFLEKLSGKTKWFGAGFRNIPVYGSDKTTYYMTGIIELLYCQGIVGTAIFGGMYLRMFIKAYKSWNKVTAIMLVLFLPYLVGSASLGVLTLCEYIPFLYIKNRDKKYKVGSFEKETICNSSNTIIIC